MRWYVLQLGLVSGFPGPGDVPLPGHLIQTDGAKNVLVDTGYPRSVCG